MENNDPSGRLTVEDLSDCRSESSHSESQLRAFQDYERVKELNLSLDKSKEDSADPKDFHLCLEGRRGTLRFDDIPSESSQTRNLSLALSKEKEFGYISNTLNDLHYALDRPSENEESADTMPSLGKNKIVPKDLLFNFREGRQKTSREGQPSLPSLSSLSSLSALSSLDRYGKDLSFAVEKDIKDFGVLKSYGFDRMKEINLSLDRMKDGHLGGFALERLRGGNGGSGAGGGSAGSGGGGGGGGGGCGSGGGSLLEGSSILEHGEFKNVHVPTRTQNLEAITLERMRRSHFLTTDLTSPNFSTQLHHPHSVTQMQQSQQQQQQHQAKSFTIDAILGLRNNQREKRTHQNHYRKHHNQEGNTKSGSITPCSGSGDGSGSVGNTTGNGSGNGSGTIGGSVSGSVGGSVGGSGSGSCSGTGTGTGSGSGNSGGNGNGSGSGSGKLKRVRTIFTAEQLERLEGEFARQQYMVGPERLYLAHALRLTEAQVKVWFQNRRIKWRKHHHEQQSQRVHEFQRTLGSSLEHEDSNETDKW